MGATKDYILALRHVQKLDPTDEENVEGKIIIVTGANSGNAICFTVSRHLNKYKARIEIYKVVKIPIENRTFLQNRNRQSNYGRVS